MGSRRYYFSTRDLLMMAALAALGGVVSTYVNAVGDLVQSIVGLAGSMQWAAGLHVLWLTLAVGLTRKQGAGTVTGILKGTVELLTGNTHGLLVVLVDVVAGLLVDLGFLPFRKKDSLLAHSVAGGLAAASNVLVFQLFAAVPTDTLAFGAMLLVSVMAFLSGVLLAGVVGWALLNGLRRAGVVKDQPAVPMGRRVYPIFLGIVALLVVVLAVFLRVAFKGPNTVQVSGAVATAYAYSAADSALPQVAGEGKMNEVTRRFTGVPLRAILEQAAPGDDAGMVLVEASDGYAFFVSMDEVQENDNLLLVAQGEGDETSYNLMGAANSKAWVRGVTRLTLVGAATIEVGGALGSPGVYDPDEWQFEMDAFNLDLGTGAAKYQGAPLGEVLDSMAPAAGATTVVLHTAGETVRLPLSEVLGSDEVRIFTNLGQDPVTFAVARTSGQVIAPQVTGIEVE